MTAELTILLLVMSLELVALSAAAHLTGVVIYVVCFGYGYEEGDTFSPPITKQKHRKIVWLCRIVIVAVMMWSHGPVMNYCLVY